MTSKIEYVVWSNEHRSWWGPNNAGYYGSLSAAGRYSREQALGICIDARGGRRYNDNPSEIPILLSDAEIFWPDETQEDRESKWRMRERERQAEEKFYSDLEG